jgi:hypothetical protein
MEDQQRKKMKIMVTSDNLQALYEQWLHHDEGVLAVYTLSFLDVKTLSQKELVNKNWQNLCKKTIDDKCGPNGPKPFQSKQELKDAVNKYCSIRHQASEMEEFACTYVI